MSGTTILRETVRIPVTVRSSVHATVYKPGQDAQGVLVLHSATATPQGFYRAFAEYAAQQGLVVITYDYRGTGLSGEPRFHARIRMRDWIQDDVAAVARWAAEHHPRLPRYAIGHSVGGHGLALDYGTEELTRAVIVSSHIATHRSIEPLRERLRVVLVLNVLGPLLTWLYGYMPGRRLGLGEDIPAAALKEWGGWTRKTGYFFDDPSMDAAQRSSRLEIPVLVLGASDDPWAGPGQMDALASFLTGAEVQRQTVSPAELGLQTIGHHGLMRRGVGEKVWPQVLHWLETGERR